MSGDDAALRSYIARHATDAHLQSFFTSKLQLLSPCEDCFDQLAHGVPGFVCCQFVDLADPGEVLLEHWEGGTGEESWGRGGHISWETLGGRPQGEQPEGCVSQCLGAWYLGALTQPSSWEL